MNSNNNNARYNIVTILVAIMVVAMLWQLFDKQILEHGKYVALAEGQQRFETVDIAKRGQIYVHDTIGGENRLYPLAFDVKSYALWVVPKQIRDKEAVSKEIGTMVGMDVSKIFGQINNDKLYVPPIKKGIGYDLADLIKAKKIPGVFVMPEYGRYYPENNLASQLLGFVNAEGKGKYGFEGHYDKELQGTAGETVGEKDTLGRVINLLNQKNPQDGTSFVLTIDRAVQYYAEKSLKSGIQRYQAEGGSVVIMDVKTGGIIAMANAPDYNPNDYKNVAKENQNLFVNPAISNLYEPGSIMKPITMAGALDSGAVTPETTETFSNYTVVDGYEIHTAQDKAFGTENMAQILQNSDNVGMAWVSEKQGKDNIYKYLGAFNLLDKTNIDLDGEATGYTPPFKHWRDINRATISFGQGIAVTPIEMVAAYAAIANKGKYLYPHLVDKIIQPDGKEIKIETKTGSQIIKEEVANQIMGMLQSVIESGHGRRAAVAGFKLGGKTGTAQIPKAEGGYEEGIYNHSFMGVGPMNDPRFVMLVKLDKPKTAEFAESTAAPVFGDIASFLLNYYYKMPPTEPVQ